MQDILTLTEAARELGLKSADGLRTQVHRGRLTARLIGKTWVITRAELERYRARSLGQVGRPPAHVTFGQVEPSTSIKTTTFDPDTEVTLGDRKPPTSIR